jgi:phosphoribosylglycinamide formyltransferase-1
MKKIVLFASGNGTNVERIFNYFKDSPAVEITAVFTNNPKAGVLKRTARLGITSVIFTKNDLYHSNKVLTILSALKPDLIVLAGFLLLIPSYFMQTFKNRIINIHPALLPKYGGKGMYGHHVHQAVIDHQEKKSGITIHFVNERYDEGQIIFQAETNIDQQETPETLASKIHQLEYEHFPRIIEQVLNNL